MSVTGIWRAWRVQSERRQESRRPLSDLRVDSPAVQLDLVDASESGLGIATERPLRVGVIYPIRLRRNGRSSQVYGRVQWSRPGEVDRFRAGLSVDKTIGPSLSTLAS